MSCRHSTRRAAPQRLRSAEDPRSCPPPSVRVALCISLHELNDAYSEVVSIPVTCFQALREEMCEVTGQRSARAVRRLRIDVEGDPADDVELGVRPAVEDGRVVDREQHLVADPGGE